MKDFLDFGLTDEFPEDVERSTGLDGRKVDDGGGGVGGDLDQFQSWNKSVFPDEFRIQSQPRALSQREAEGFKALLISYIRQR
jgi:hypothetical protein